MILEKNKSKCCNAEIQVFEKHFGGLGANYTDRTFICLKCKLPLSENEMVYNNGNKNAKRNKKLEELQEVCKTDIGLSKTGRLQMIALLEGMKQ